MLAVLLLLGAVAAGAQTVEGTVSNAATGAGAAGVKVELIKGGTPFYETISDGGGRFRFDNIREGDYAARYQSPDYFVTAGFANYQYFHVAAGDPVKLEERLLPFSKLSGRVVDPDGNPIANAPVELTGSGMMVNGRTYLRSSTGGGGGGALNEAPPGMGFLGEKTDDRGRFALLVMPGAYGIAVIPPRDLKPPAAEPDRPALLWKRTFYPGVTRQEDASKLQVLPGTEVSVVLKLLAVPSHTVRGVVLEPDGTPAPHIKVSAASTGFPPASGTESNAEGTFELSGVSEGDYLVQAEVERDSVRLRATSWIEVNGHDLENVKLRLAAPATVRVIVTMESPKDGPAARAMPLMLAAGGDRGRGRNFNDLGFIAGAPIDVGSRRDFTIELYPGSYYLGPHLQPPPAPYYLDSVNAGGANLMIQDVEIGPGATINVVYKTDGGSVSGKAEKCFSGGVLLVPADPALHGRGFSRSGPCDAKDHYDIPAVRPGDYYALAFAGNGPVLTVDQALINEAVKVTVKAGEAASADLKTITKPVF